jgi:eukaryotic-like serine/threonine-protein kinase
MENGASTRIRLGKFELDLATGELCGDGETVQLGEKSFRVLSALTETGGQLVTREALQEKLWPNDTIVDFEHGINTAIKLLRRALGDSADSPKYIETIPRRGYRLIVPVERVEAPDGKVGDLRDAGVEVRAMSLPGVMSGTTVTHYRLDDVIGSGGMGVVYRAEDLNLQRSVAVKFLQEELGGSPQAFARFRREAHAISLLDHTNICPIYEYGEHHGQPFIVMPLLKGETLREKLRKGALPIRTAINLGVQVAPWPGRRSRQGNCASRPQARKPVCLR